MKEGTAKEMRQEPESELVSTRSGVLSPKKAQLFRKPGFWASRSQTIQQLPGCYTHVSLPFSGMPALLVGCVTDVCAPRLALAARPSTSCGVTRPSWLRS